MTADLALGSPEPASPAVPPMTAAELMGRAALIHAAIDEYEMNTGEEYAMRKRAEERHRPIRMPVGVLYGALAP